MPGHGPTVDFETDRVGEPDGGVAVGVGLGVGVEVLPGIAVGVAPAVDCDAGALARSVGVGLAAAPLLWCIPPERTGTSTLLLLSGVYKGQR